MEEYKVAVLIPCYNEEVTIAKVIQDFRTQLPNASIYVFDNCSTDKSAEIAKENDAIVMKEPRQGKGFVIESMFDRVVADYYIMVDGDDTYPADKVHELLAPVVAGDADIVVGARLEEFDDKAFRPFHVIGNKLVQGLIKSIFRTKLRDIFSGYRVFNRKAILRIPIISSGFEVETEMTIQSLYHQLKMIEISVPYGARPDGSFSKLSTLRDGTRVLWKWFTLFYEIKPLTFFGMFGILWLVAGLLIGSRPIHDYVTTGMVPHFPSAILAASLVLLSFLFFFSGILLHAINRRFRELHNTFLRGKK